MRKKGSSWGATVAEELALRKKAFVAYYMSWEGRLQF